MDIVSKITGNTVSATEFNQIPTELEAGISVTGQTPSDAILNQVPIFVSRFAANNFYIDSGTADNYVLTLASSFTNPVSSTVPYFTGMTIRFRAGNAGTGGAATVNVNGAGVKNLKEADGTTNPTSIPTTEDSEYRYDGTVFRKVNSVGAATESTAGISKLPKQITVSNGTDANNDIDFSAGNFQFSDGSGIASLSALTKRLDATWVAGTNQGGLDTGAKANNTPYYCFAIYNPASGISDALFSASKTSPTMPSGYTKRTYIGALHTNGSANIRDGKWLFNPNGSYYFEYSTTISDYSGSPTNTLTDEVLTVPPLMIAVLSLNFGADFAETAGRVVNFKNKVSGQTFNAIQSRPISSTSNPQTCPCNIQVDSSSNIQIQVPSGTAGNLTINNRGFIDNNI